MGGAPTNLISIKDMNRIAGSRGGKCLSEKYVNALTKLKWECSEGHVWEAIPCNIKRGHWCPTCAGNKKLSIEKMQQLAGEKGGKCLSERYVNNHTKLQWQCTEGHVWEAFPRDIKRNHWCRICGGTEKLSIEEMQRLAGENGGRCLSEEYVNARTKLKWQCDEGHVWEAIPASIKRGYWCPTCGKGVRKLSIEEMQQLARKKGGKCLSEEYVNSYTKLKWQCDEGHVWEAIPDSIKRGHWCPNCGAGKLSIEEMQRLAEEKGGRCLSKVYINNRTKLKWGCSEGHVWEAQPSNIKLGAWCPTCAGCKKLSIEEMHRLAEGKGGRCLSEKYINACTRLKWQCGEGHVWEGIPSNIKYHGEWCPTCAGVRKLSIEEMQQLAEDRGGECLSTEYVNELTKLKWKCSEGHVWEAIPGNVVRGRWCPQCRYISSISERICRKIFEEIFRKEFPSSRPKWLIGEKGNPLELDGYNKELNLAFEYQGKQHYEYIEIYHKTKNKFLERVDYDSKKIELCKKSGVTLIEVPYNIKMEDMQDYIIKKCKDVGVQLPRTIKKIGIHDLNVVYETNKLKEMQQVAEDKGGKCLSKIYVNARTKLMWECSKGHVWETMPDHIKHNHWCPYCARVKKKYKIQFIEKQKGDIEIADTEKLQKPKI